MKVHITLVGGQPAPVYHGIKAVNPDKVIFIYSNSSLRSLNALKNEIKDIEFDERELDVTDPQKIKKCAEELAKKYEKDEVTVNISSGLKSWSHWFGVIFQNCSNAEVVYMDQNNVLWNYKTMKSTNNFNFDMHALFRLYGNPLTEYVPYTDFTKDDFDAIEKIEKVRNFNNTIFNKLTLNVEEKKEKTDKTRKNQFKSKKKGSFEEDRSWVKWNKDLPQVELLVYDRKNRKKECKITSPHAINLVFNAGWFELKVAKLLACWKNAKEICMNCHFVFDSNRDKNEVDIIVNTGTKNLFVECKTKIHDTTAIDKFRSVIKNYGGMGSKGLFVTDAPMNDMAKAKCEEHGILTFSLQEQHLGMSVDQALYWLLNSELKNINTK